VPRLCDSERPDPSHSNDVRDGRDNTVTSPPVTSTAVQEPIVALLLTVSRCAFRGSQLSARLTQFFRRHQRIGLQFASIQLRVWRRHLYVALLLSVRILFSWTWPLVVGLHDRDVHQTIPELNSTTLWIGLAPWPGTDPVAILLIRAILTYDMLQKTTELLC